MDTTKSIHDASACSITHPLVATTAASSPTQQKDPMHLARPLHRLPTKNEMLPDIELAKVPTLQTECVSLRPSVGHNT